MRRFATACLLGLALLAGSCRSEEEAAVTPTPSVNQPGSSIQPLPVLQFGHGAMISAVRWINDGRNLVSIDSTGLLLIWDVDKRLILDRVHTGMYTWLSSIEVQPDGDKLSLIYAVEVSTDELGRRQVSFCPEGAMRDEQWCTLALDLATRELLPDQSVAVPDQVEFGQGSTKLAESFPLSPDGRWRPETFRAVDRPELANPDAGIVHVPEPEEYPGYDCASPTRCDYGIALNAVAEGVAPIALVGERRAFVSDLDISPDGHLLVQSNSFHTTTRSWSQVRTTDLLLYEPESEVENTADYLTVDWFDNRRFTMLGRGYADYADRNSDEFETGNLFRALPLERALELQARWEVRDRDPFPATRLVDRDCLASGDCPSAPAYYAMEPLDELGNYIGQGDLDYCTTVLGNLSCEAETTAGEAIGEASSQDPMLGGISRYDAASGRWQRMVQPDWTDETIWAIRLSPDRSRLAVLTRAWEGDGPEPTLRLRLFDIVGTRLEQVGPVLVEKSYAGSPDYGEPVTYGGNEVDPLPMLRFTPDGSRIAFSHFLNLSMDTDPEGYELVVVDADGGAPARHHLNHSQSFIMLDADRAFEVESGRIVDLDTGDALATVRDRPELLNAGMIADSGLIWGAGADGRVQFWDLATGALELSLFMLPDDRFFAMTPGGRYDTNLGPDSRAMRWIVRDDPWRSLAPQTFMRDFYEPGLYAKLLDCRAQDNCNTAFRPLPAFDEVNRVLPTVEIVEIVPAANPAEVTVTVEARAGENAAGQAVSGIYNLRLFRDGRLVAMTPAGNDELSSGVRSWQDTVERWQRVNTLGDDAVYRASFTVPLPTGDGETRHVFSAYAFNEDRIKSESAERTYTVEPHEFLPRPRRAFVINIGIDGYADSRLQLNYAVADADLLRRQLASISGYEVRQVSLAARRGRAAPGVTRQAILDALRLLSGPEDRPAIIARLDRAGIDARALQTATPDDLVIITYSGHGWTDSVGNFFLVPSNGEASAEGGNLGLLVSAADLANVLRGNQAGEIALVIDACFSSAIVESGAFKPGPLGDPGLGQLAYDKRILILSASQADNYAIESSSLNHGLLTYALAGAGEGLDLSGNADADGNGAIRLDEWLAYAERRLPSLSADMRIRRYDARRGSAQNVAPEIAREDYIQRPTLFDFNASPSRVNLRPL